MLASTFFCDCRIKHQKRNKDKRRKNVDSTWKNSGIVICCLKWASISETYAKSSLKVWLKLTNEIIFSKPGLPKRLPWWALIKWEQRGVIDTIVLLRSNKLLNLLGTGDRSEWKFVLKIFLTAILQSSRTERPLHSPKHEHESGFPEPLSQNSGSQQPFTS